MLNAAQCTGLILFLNPLQRQQLVDAAVGPGGEFFQGVLVPCRSHGSPRANSNSLVVGLAHIRRINQQRPLRAPDAINGIDDHQCL